MNHKKLYKRNKNSNNKKKCLKKFINMKHIHQLLKLQMTFNIIIITFIKESGKVLKFN